MPAQSTETGARYYNKRNRNAAEPKRKNQDDEQSVQHLLAQFGHRPGVFKGLKHLKPPRLSACGFDLLLCGSRESSCLNGQLLGQRAGAEDLDAVESILNDAGIAEDLCSYLSAVFKLLQCGNIDRCVSGAENVVEPRFGRRRARGIWPPSKPGRHRRRNGPLAL